MSGVPYAELIGDPVAHSRSPAIHNFWLKALELDGEYRAIRVTADGIGGYLRQRRADPVWRGCSVTAPLKQAILPYLDRLSIEAEAVGAVNCVMPVEDGLVGLNTDLDGIAEALASLETGIREATIIGAGGAARAAAWHLFEHGCTTLNLLLRDPAKATGFIDPKTGCEIVVHVLSEPEPALANSDLLINATPLGQTGYDPPPPNLLEAVAAHRRALAVFDMVYDPERTLLLEVAGGGSHRSIGGMAMLIGQARHAFWLFFGNNVPRARDRDLRRSLCSGGSEI